jgi:hypothetical protein
VGLRGRIRKLEQAAEEEMLTIPQDDGTVKRFPPEAAADALLDLMDGRDHPLAEAARNSPDPEWQRSFYNAFPINPDEVEVPGPRVAEIVLQRVPDKPR